MPIARCSNMQTTSQRWRKPWINAKWWQSIAVLMAMGAGAGAGAAGLAITASGNAQAQGRPLPRWQIANPYCSITTVVVPPFPGQARAWMLRSGEPIIYLGKTALTNPSYKRFLLAHECCHHSRGHVKRLYRAMTRNGRILTITRSMIQIELDADCCAAKTLARAKDLSAIGAAENIMGRYGKRPTGPRYPRGSARKAVIANCAAQASSGTP